MVQYRHVVNDAVVGAWEDMPELKDETIQGLYAYLNTCLNGKWSGEMLRGIGGWNGNVIDYGYRTQFKFDRKITEEELAWLKDTKDKLISSISKCLCGGEPSLSEEMMMIGDELSCIVYCQCGMQYGNTGMKLTKSEAINGWNKIIGASCATESGRKKNAAEAANAAYNSSTTPASKQASAD